MKKLLLKTTTIAASLLLSSTLYASDKSHASHWGYAGDSAPIHWGDLKAEYERCGDGDRQSPIDIKTKTAAATLTMGGIDTSYTDAPLHIINNGHTIQVNSDGRSSAILGGKKYTLLQYHFHAGSEHTVDGKQHPMEAHLVHQSEDGELGVIGVFMDVGTENKFLKEVFDAMPAHAGDKEVSTTKTLYANELLPDSKSYYHYLGSLTTPPCTQIVEWYVMQEPIYYLKSTTKTV